MVVGTVRSGLLSKGPWSSIGVPLVGTDGSGYCKVKPVK